MAARRDLGALLVDESVIGRGDLERAERQRRERGAPLWSALLEAQLTSEDEIYFVLAKRFGTAVADEEALVALTPFSDSPEDERLRRAMRAEEARAMGIAPLELTSDGSRVTVVMVDPSDEESLARFVERVGASEGRALLGRRSAVERAIARLYGLTDAKPSRTPPSPPPPPPPQPSRTPPSPPRPIGERRPSPPLAPPDRGERSERVDRGDPTERSERPPLPPRPNRPSRPAIAIAPEPTGTVKVDPSLAAEVERIGAHVEVLPAATQPRIRRPTPPSPSDEATTPRQPHDVAASPSNARLRTGPADGPSLPSGAQPGAPRSQPGSRRVRGPEQPAAGAAPSQPSAAVTSARAEDSDSDLVRPAAEVHTGDVLLDEERLRRALLQTIEILCTKLEERLPTTSAEGDTDRLQRPGVAAETARLSRRVARQLGLPRPLVDEIGVAAQLFVLDRALKQLEDGGATDDLFGELGWASARDGALTGVLRALTASSAGFARPAGVGPAAPAPVGAVIVGVVQEYLELGANTAEADLDAISQLLRTSSRAGSEGRGPVVDALLRVLESERLPASAQALLGDPHPDDLEDARAARGAASDDTPEHVAAAAGEADGGAAAAAGDGRADEDKTQRKLAPRARPRPPIDPT
jgi:hypothetical protein